MPATRPPDEIRSIAQQIIIKRLTGASIAQAARDLRVSRQAIYGFKSGKYCPSIAVIRRACQVWSIEFLVRGMKVSASSFEGPEAIALPTLQAVPFQPSLFDLWSELHNQKMTVVSAKKVDGAVEMTLRIAVPA